MGFHEQAIFPSKIARGSTFGPGYNTAIVEVRGGAETRTSYYEQPRHYGDVSQGISTWDELMDIKRFYIARLGGAYGFRFPDPLDNTSHPDGTSAPGSTDQYLGDGDGSTTVFQLRKQYIDAGITRNRPIQKPVEGSVSVSINDVNQGSGWSVNTTNGEITFTSPPPSGQSVKAGFRYHVPVRFDDDADKGLLTNFQEFNNGAVQPIGIIELVDERPTDDEAFRGGSRAFNLENGADVAITPADGLLMQVTPLESGRKVILPPTQYLEGGGPYFYIQNNSQTESFDLNTDAFTTLVTLAPTEVYQLLILVQGGGQKTWFAIGPF